MKGLPNMMDVIVTNNETTDILSSVSGTPAMPMLKSAATQSHPANNPVEAETTQLQAWSYTSSGSTIVFTTPHAAAAQRKYADNPYCSKRMATAQTMEVNREHIVRITHTGGYTSLPATKATTTRRGNITDHMPKAALFG